MEQHLEDIWKDNPARIVLNEYESKRLEREDEMNNPLLST
jgi:hypothetical protein